MTSEDRQGLFRLFRASSEANFQVFLNKLQAKYEEYDNVIDAEEYFEEKKKEDKWWKKALQRVSNTGKIKEEDKEK